MQLNANTPSQATIQPTGGEPLAPDVRANLERSFGVDLRSVRVHTDERAQNTARRMDARAFTLGANIFLGRGERPSDLRLLAHEVAHVVQQRSVPTVQRWSFSGGDRYEREAQQASAAAVQHQSFAVRERTTPRPQRLGISDALDYFADAANNIPGFSMLTFVLGFNPINMRSVERNATNLFRAIIGFLPGGNLIFQALQRHGIIDQVGGWLQQQLATLGLAASSLRQALDRFLDSLGWSDIFDLGGVWDRAKRIFTEPIDRIISFLGGVVSDILRFIRDAILRPVARLAEGTRAYDLMRLILGQDPITGDPYPRTAENMIGGFMRLIGQEEKWQHLQQSGAIPRAWAWFQQQVSTLLGFVRQIPQLFVQLWESLQISDLLDIGGAFNKVRDIFGGFVSSFISWAGEAALQIMLFIFEVLAPGALPVLRRAAAVIRTIISDPIRFVGNLVRAGLRGFQQFRDNIRTHLINGLVGWLTGALSGAGLQLPSRWDLRGILSLVLQILGLTWQNIRQKLVRVLGETTVTVLERTFDIVVTLVREGPLAAWQKILENLSNLQETIFSGIREWVIRTIVGQAVIRIVSMLNPAGAVIQAIIAIYNTIMFFRERLQQIIQVAEAFFNSIAEIANGAIGAAANYVERTMARLVPVVISFLARLIGLGGISDTIRNIIARIRAPIDRALDRVVEWIAAQARRLGRAVAGAARGVIGWWRQRRSFRGADGATHALYFTGEGAAARVTVASEPMPVEQFLDSIRTNPDYQTPPKPALIQQVRQQVDAIRRAQALPAAQQAQAEQQINAAFTALGPLLAQLVGSTQFATEDHPLPLAYPKRRWSAYPTIYVGPRASNRITQADLAAGNVAAIQAQLTAAERTAWAARGNAIEAYRPTQRRALPGGDTIGIDGNYRTEPGKKIRLVPQSTQGGGLINSALSPFGYRARSENMDGDHVIEMQLGGPNILPNLWPLEAGENRSSGSTIASMTFTKPDGTRIAMEALKNRARSVPTWLIITGTR